MTPEDLQKRTKKFALDIIVLARELESIPLGRYISGQIFRSGTSVAANYRACCKSRSSKDFIAKLGIVIEEADETNFWLDLLEDSGFVSHKRVSDLISESKEIVAIMVASKNSAIRNHKKL